MKRLLLSHNPFCGEFDLGTIREVIECAIFILILPVIIVAFIVLLVSLGIGKVTSICTWKGHEYFLHQEDYSDYPTRELIDKLVNVPRFSPITSERPDISLEQLNAPRCQLTCERCGEFWGLGNTSIPRHLKIAWEKKLFISKQEEHRRFLKAIGREDSMGTNCPHRGMGF